jgi:dTDP-4-amino-4,6-dideoxygalactose transaminase
MRRVFLSAPDVTDVERNLLLEAFDSGWITSVGASLDAFEVAVAEMAGVEHAVALSSGTAGLHLALLTVGVQPGDEVFVSSFTFAATANAIRYCGATPVFIDSDTTSWNLDPALLADALATAAGANRLPKAVLAVDLYGQCADYDQIESLCAQYGVALVEDAAEALGAAHRGRPAGSFGTVGVFSFNGNKIATTSGGGMVVTDDHALAERVRYLATQAREPVVHYEHLETGYNYRLSNLLAAVGLGQVQRLPSMIERRHQIHGMYRQGLADTGVEFMPVPEWSTWNGWLTCVVFGSAAEANAVRQALDAVDVESRPLWKPMHLQPAFADCRAVGGRVSEHLFQTGLCLPSGSGLADDEIERVIDGVRTALGQHGKMAS